MKTTIDISDIGLAPVARASVDAALVKVPDPRLRAIDRETLALFACACFTEDFLMRVMTQLEVVHEARHGAKQ